MTSPDPQPPAKWKKVAKQAACYGAIYAVFGVFGMGFVLYKWLGPPWRRAKKPEAEATEGQLAKPEAKEGPVSAETDVVPTIPFPSERAVG